MNLNQIGGGLFSAIAASFNTVFQLEWGNNATGDYGVLGATGQINTRCSVSCHFGTDPSIYKYYRAHTSPFLTAIALADINGADPLPAEAGYTNDRAIRVSFTAGGAAPTQMRCAEDISFTVNATGWIAYPGSTYDYTLSDSDGNRNVSCQLRNEQGSSHIKTVPIVLDRQGPSWATNALTAPNGGESWAQDSAQSITWNPAGVSDPYLKAGDIISLEYSIDGGATFPNSIATGEANDGSYAWTVPVVDSATARIRVSAYDKAGNRGSDGSNANFTIQALAPALNSITVADNDNADPAPAEAGYTNKQSVAVTFGTTNYPTQMMLAEDSGFSVNSTGWIAFNANATYSLSAGDGAKTVYAKVKNSAGESVVLNQAIVLDTVAPTIQATTLTAPNGAEYWTSGSTQNVTWNSGHITDANLGATPIKLAYSADDGTNYSVWSDWESNDGAYSWILPTAQSYMGKLKVVVYDRGGNTAEDVSNANLYVSPPSNYIVTNTNDSGAGSLRQAMTDLVVAGGNNTIWFNIPSGSLTNGVAVINVATDLPALSAANIIIDGASQTALVGNTNPNGPEVLIDGPCATGSYDCLGNTYTGFNITGAGVTIKDMQIANIGTAIRSAAANTVIRGNHLGYSSDTVGFTTKQNYFNIVLTNTSTNAIIGGSNPSDRNYVTSAFYNGIFSNGASGMQIINNAIGLRSNNSVAANSTFASDAGVLFNSGSNGLVKDNIFIGSSYGLYLAGTSSNNVVKGNTFGAYYNAGAWTSVGTPYTGVYFSGSSVGSTGVNIIGGPNVAINDTNLNDSNVMASGTSGIYIYQATAYTTRIFGNFIGTNPAQNQVFAGVNGIMTKFVSGVTIGGADAGEAGNVIANQTGYGVLLDPSSQYVEISRNSFYNNGDNALDDAFHLNGGNSNYPRPTISAVSTSTATVTGIVSGNLVEVYAANFGGAEYGEGKTFVGSAVATSTSVTVPVSGVSQGDSLTAVRAFVDANGKISSPFSKNKRLAGAAVPTLDWTGEAGYITDGVNPDSGLTGTNFTFRVKYTDADNDPPGAIEVWVDINNNGSYDANEKLAMSAVNGGDTVYTDGKLYTRTIPMAKVLGGVHNYRFYANDDLSDATGSPTSSKTVTVQSCSGLAVNPAGTYFEAENFLATLNQGGATFTLDTSTAGYKGTGFLTTLGISTTVPPTEQGKIYPMNFATTGNYTVWMRAYGTSSTNKSVFVGRDGDWSGALSTGFTYFSWIWTKIADAGSSTINIGTAGSHSFNIWVRDGFKVDAFYLTQGAETPTDASVLTSTIINPAVCVP